MFKLTTIKKKIITSFAVVVPFFILYSISKIFLYNIYFFEWSSRHLYCYIWLVAVLLVLRNNTAYAVTLSISNIAGVILGQFIGDIIREMNVQTITIETPDWQIHKLQIHLGFVIWISTILISLTLSFILCKLIKGDFSFKKKNQINT